MQLVGLAAAQTDALTCKLCGADVRVVPGCTYGAEERAQFEELCEVVAEVQLTTVQAQQLAQEAERALWSGAFTRALEKLASHMPGLVPMQSAAGTNWDAQHRILMRLKPILEALSTTSRVSAEYSIGTDPSRRGAGRL